MGHFDVCTDLTGVNMELYSNELALESPVEIRYEDVQRLARLYRELKAKGINICRISQKDQEAVFEQLKNLGNAARNASSFLFSFLQQPYESDDVNDEQDQYLDHQWSLQGKDCYGLALAAIMESMALSLVNEVWDQAIISIRKDEEEIQARNLFGTETFEIHRSWLERNEPIELATCVMSPVEKNVKVREDHGQDELLRFSKRLVNSEYVCEIINSLEFHEKERHFIHKIKDKGIIEIVLPWTKHGYGIAVQTTGRNRRETEAIAAILKEKYGHR